MLTTEQLEARKAGIGGSDVAAIMGLSPWKTKHEVYLEKRGEIVPENIDDKEYVHFGNVLEQVVADEYARRNDCKVERRNQMIVSKDYEFMLANIDRKRVGEKRGLECKTADKFTRGKWGEAGTDQVPEYYHIQCGHYMNVLDYPVWDLAVLIGGNEYRDYTLERNKELSELLEESCIKFWEQVTKGIPPEIDFTHQSTIGMIKRLYPGTNGETIMLPDDLERWHQVKVDAEAEVKQYQAVVDACKNRIMAAIGENACGVLPNLETQYKRSFVKKKEYVSPATEYSMMRNSKYTPPKEGS